MEDLDLVYRWFSMTCRHNPQVESYSTKAFCETSLMDSGEGTSTQWAEIWATHMVVLFAWKEQQRGV